MRRTRLAPRRALSATGAAAVLLLAGCDIGKAQDATRVADTSAELHADIHSDDPGTLTWWFEYGPTEAMGVTTPEATTTFPAAGSPPRAVSAFVTGLAEGITHHYRACVRNAQGGGACGRTLTFTTTTARDSVHGFGVASEIPELGYYNGAIVDATSAADGSSPAGQASRSPGVHYFRIPDEGDVTCLRAEGGRAAVGFVGDATEYNPDLPLVYLVLFIDDVGPAGDRFAVEQVLSTPTSCPDPDEVDEAAWQTLTRGDFVVHDHP